MATDGVTALDVAHVPDKTSDDVITGAWKFTKAIGTPGGVSFARNGNLETWLAGTAVAPTNWTLTGSGATVARDGTNFKIGTFAAALTRVGNDCYLAQNAVTSFGPAAWWQNRQVTFGAWVRATAGSRARLHIHDGVGSSASEYHTGTGLWEWITVTRTIDNAATQVEIRLAVDTGNTTVQFDGATLVLGAGIPEFVSGILDFARLDEASRVLAQWQFDLPVGNAGATSWAFNGDFELWGQPAGFGVTQPTRWVLTGSGATSAKNSSNVKVGSASANLTRSGTNCYLGQDIAGFHGPATRWRGKVVTFGCWVRASVASAARLTIHDGIGSTTSSSHTGSGNFEWLQVTRTIDAAATTVEMRCELILDTTVQFDGATLVMGASVQDYIPGAWQGRRCNIMVGVGSAQAQATTHYLGPGGNSLTETQTSFRVPYKGVASRLHTLLDTTPTAGQTVTVTIRSNETDDSALSVTHGNAEGRDAENVTDEVEFASGDVMSFKSVTSATVGSRWVRASIRYEEIP
jgi:hypothetical protein